MLYKIVRVVDGRLLSIGVPIKYAFEYTPGEKHVPLFGWGPFAVCPSLSDARTLCLNLYRSDPLLFAKVAYQLWGTQGHRSDESNLYMPGELFGEEHPIVQPTPDNTMLLSHIYLTECQGKGTLIDLVNA